MPRFLLHARSFPQSSPQSFPHRSPARRGDSAWLLILFAASLLWAFPACDVTASLPNDNGAQDSGGSGGGGGGNVEPPAPVPNPTIMLTFSNRTDFVVEPQIFISTNGPGLTAETLFVDSNGFTEGVGLASSGLLAPNSADVVELKCAEGLVIGTTGGRFLDAETGDEVGVGSLRILQQGLVFDCGAKIAIIFGLENGEFTASIVLE